MALLANPIFVSFAYTFVWKVHHPYSIVNSLNTEENVSLRLWGCPTKITQTGDLTEIYFTLFWWMGVQKQGVERLGLSWSPSPGFADDHLHALSSLDLFSMCIHCRYLFLFLWWHSSYWVRVLHLWPHLNVLISLKALSPSTVILGVRLQHMNLGRVTKFSSL